MSHLWCGYILFQQAKGLTDLLNEVEEGVQYILVKFFARKAAWFKD